MKEMSKSKALVINMLASIITFVVSFGISFFMTPFLTDTVGEEAYGFVGLANNFVNYIMIITVALNSVAGRFITISYHQGKKEEANRYFTSVLVANVVLALIILLGGGILILRLDHVIKIAPELVVSVKWLFAFVLLNFLITIVGNVYTVATFITNTLYLSSIANIVTALARVGLLVAFYGFLPANVAYIGLATAIATAIGMAMNVVYTRRLVPELRLQRQDASMGKVKELFMAGIWSSISKLSQVLSDGLDLLITNQMLSSFLMGELSIAQQIPSYCATLISTLTNLFNPNITEYYAKGDTEAVVKELKTGMKLSGFFTNIIFCGMVAFGSYFFTLWVPNQDVRLIYTLSCVIVVSMCVSGVTTALNNVFLVTNHLKVNSLFWLVVSFCNVAIVFVVLLTTDIGVYAVAGVSKLTGILGNLIFIPIYAAKCLEVKKTTFYPLIFRYMGTTGLMLLLFFGLKQILFVPGNWITFILLCGIAGLLGAIMNYFVLLNSYERGVLKNKLLRRKSKS